MNEAIGLFILPIKKPSANISSFIDPEVYAVEKISLSDFVKKVGQARVARALGVKPASIAKALKMRRSIEVTVESDGSCIAQEVRPFPSHAPDDLVATQAKSSRDA